MQRLVRHRQNRRPFGCFGRMMCDRRGASVGVHLCEKSPGHHAPLGESSMVYFVLFEDNPSLGTGVRRQHMPAHLSCLEKNAACIKAAGPLREPSGDAAGGLWFVDADSAEAVDALVKEDPFWPTGLRRSVRILNWAQVFRSEERRVGKECRSRRWPRQS